MSDRRSQFCTH